MPKAKERPKAYEMREEEKTSALVKSKTVIIGTPNFIGTYQSPRLLVMSNNNKNNEIKKEIFEPALAKQLSQSSIRNSPDVSP